MDAKASLVEQRLIVCGPDNSDRAAYIDRLFAEASPRSLLLLPSAYAARDRLVRLAQSGSLRAGWGVPVQDLTAFAARLLECETGVPPNRLSAIDRTEVVRCTLQALPEDLADYGIATALDSPGLARELLRVITELKQAAIEPEDFSRRVDAAKGPRDRLVDTVYHRYQAHLLSNNRYDTPGLFWEAYVRCEESRPAILGGVERLLLDGFDDFTPSELRVVQALARWVPEMALGICYDDRAERQDLFEIGRRTLQALGAALGARVEQRAAGPVASFRDYANEHIFARMPTQAAPGHLAADFRIVPYADSAHESEAIARAVKHLLIDGTAPEEILIASPRPGSESLRIYRACNALGLPCALDAGMPLLATGPGALLGNLLRAWTSGERESVLDVLLSPWYRPVAGLASAPPDQRFLWPQLARLAGIVEDTRWRRLLEPLAEEIANGKHRERITRRADAAAAARALAHAADTLFDLFEQIPPEGSAKDLAGAMRAVLEVALHVSESGGRTEAQEADPIDTAARITIGRMVGGFAATAGGRLARTAFLAALEAALRESHVAMPKRGCVLITDLAGLRNRSVPYVFVGGLIEGEFPARIGTRSLYARPDLERFARQGIVLADADHDLARQRLLVHHMLCSATKCLQLSWPLLKDKARDTWPSPYLNEIRRLFASESGVEANLPGSSRLVATAEEAASPREYVLAIGQGRSKAATITGVSETLLEQVARASQIERRRYSVHAFDAFDGALGERPQATQCATRFDRTHRYSAGQFEAYQSCPFGFFAGHVLHLDAAEAPRWELGAIDRGILAHDVLQRFHRAHAGAPLSKLDLDVASSEMAAIVVHAFAAHSARLRAFPSGVVYGEQERLRAVLARYLRALPERQGEPSDWEPVYFEFAFGEGSERATTEDHSGTEDVALEVAGEIVLVSGRIDRIDQDGTRLRLVDYKTGRVPNSTDLHEGLAIQLALYTLLASRLFPDYTCEDAVYLHVGAGKSRDALRTQPRTGPEVDVRNHVREAIADTIAGARKGCFPPTPKAQPCFACTYAKICRHEKARIERKRAETGNHDVDA